MIKKVNRFINSSIITSILFIVLGVMMMLFPQTSLEAFSYIVSILLILLGIYLFVMDFGHYFFPLDAMLSGIFMFLLGIVIFMYPETLSFIIPIALGVWVILSSVLKIKIAVLIKNMPDSPWIAMLVMAILSLVCGVLFVLNPLSSSSIITVVSGSIIIAYAIVDFVEMIIFKKNINKIAKAFKEYMKLIEE